MKKIKLKIITPYGEFLNKEVEIVTLKTTEGYIGLQPSRTPFVAALEIAEMRIGAPINKTAAIAGGMVEVTKNHIYIITEAIEFKELINIKRAQKEKEHAELVLKKEKSKEELLKAQISLAKALNRINIGKKTK